MPCNRCKSTLRKNPDPLYADCLNCGEVFIGEAIENVVKFIGYGTVKARKPVEFAK